MSLSVRTVSTEMPRAPVAGRPKRAIGASLMPIMPLGDAFSSLELTVISLAANPRERRAGYGRRARLLRRLGFGHEVTSLACPRLEALRQAAACLHADTEAALPADMLDAFVGAGWREGDIAEVRAVIAARTTTLAPDRSGSKPSRAAPAALAPP